ncbi:MAG: RecB family exonuclease [bacterium]
MVLYIKYSPRNLEMYERCPLQFKFEYVDRLRKEYGRPTPGFSLGQSIHAALRDFFSIEDVRQRTLDKLHQLLRQNWQKGGYRTPDEEREYGQRALEILEVFYENNDITVKPVYVERPMNAFIDAKFKDIVFTGRVDRVDRVDDNHYRIIDYKTGKVPITQEEADDSLQFTIYFILLKQNLKIAPQSLLFHYIYCNVKIFTQRDDKRLKEHWKRIREIIERINESYSSGVFEPRLNRFCRSCFYGEICPLKRGEIQPADDYDEDSIPF